MDFKRIIDDVPDYQEFLTVDEMDAESLALAEEYPDICTCTKVGESRNGHPIYCLKIGEGSKNAFMFGCPHPNEPMGAMMLSYFSRKLCEDDEFRKEIDYTWYLIKSIDVDGTKLNENWFKGPFNLTTYARNFFRPSADEQAEWTFPIDYKTLHFHNPIPETQVLMKIIDETKPTFMYSLHNAGFGGAYWYISREMPEVYDDLHKAAEEFGIPLHLGEPEMPYIQEFAPAIYKLTGTADDYDFMEKFGNGEDPAKQITAGTSSDDYAKKYGTMGLVAELPYYYSPKIIDQSGVGYPREKAAREAAEISRNNSIEVEEYYKLWKDDVKEHNPFANMLDMGIQHRELNYQSTMNFIDSNPDFKEECTVSQEFDNLEVSRFYCLLSWGLCVRGAEWERDKATGADKERLQEIVDKIDAKLHEKAAEVEKIGYSFVPIQRLVRSQLSSGLIIASKL